MIQVTTDGSREASGVAQIIVAALLGLTEVEAKGFIAWAWRQVEACEASSEPFEYGPYRDTILRIPGERWATIDNGLRIGWKLNYPGRQLANGVWRDPIRTLYVERDPSSEGACKCIGCKDGRAPWSSYK